MDETTPCENCKRQSPGRMAYCGRCHKILCPTCFDAEEHAAFDLLYAMNIVREGQSGISDAEFFGDFSAGYGVEVDLDQADKNKLL